MSSLPVTQGRAARAASRVDSIARAVLYEGYSLYPYRETSLKNRKRVLFGTLLPRAWVDAHESGDASEASTECLLAVGGASSPSLDVRVSISVRFLKLGESASDSATPEEVVSLEDLRVTDLETHGAEKAISVHYPAIVGAVSVTATTVTPGLVRVRVVVKNLTTMAPGESRDDAEAHGLGAAHVVLVAERAHWVSLLDPPPAHAAAAAACTQKGLWPVLAGDDAMLAAPIILYDHPAIAPESAAGDLYDATEIEEILALRVQTLSDGEKSELRHDDVTRALLERVEALGPAELERLHGTLRGRAPRTTITIGEQVTLQPKARADALDVILRGLAATVVSIEETLEGEQLVCVTVDRDPGRDLGARGFPGHRFFFRPDELERAPRERAP